VSGGMAPRPGSPWPDGPADCMRRPAFSAPHWRATSAATCARRAIVRSHVLEFSTPVEPSL
jgi:hypothetical protein